MQFVQNEYSKRFVEALNFLKDSGYFANWKDFYDKIGYDKTSLSKLLKGERNVTIELVGESQNLFGINSEYVITGKGNLIVKNKDQTENLGMVNEPTVGYLTGLPNRLPNDEKHLKNAHLKLLEWVTPIPVVDINVAAGGGYMNPDYLETVEYIMVPKSMLRKGDKTRIFVPIRGDSMSPTLFDGSKLLITLVDRFDWEYISNDYVNVIFTTEGKGYVKRIKNRLKDKGFITCCSDHIDKSTHPNFNLNEDEINTIWNAELYISHKMPNINDDYHSKLNRLENTVDDLMEAVRSHGELLKRLGKDKLL